MSDPYRRTDRTLPLKDASSYPGSDFLDMVLFLPAGEGETYHLWLLTDATSPAIEINAERFEPVKVHEGPPRWVDFGAGHEFFGRLSPPGKPPYSQVRFYGITLEEAASSHFVLTPQEDLELCGTIEDAERALWGIARAEVGTTAITPSQVQVGRATTFQLTWRLGSRALPAEARLRLSTPSAFPTPQTDDPDRPGWIEVVRSDAPVVLESIADSPETYLKVDVIYRLPEGMPPNGAAELVYRTDFTYLHEWSSDTLERRYWYSQLPVLALDVSLDGKKPYVPPLDEAGHRVEYVSGPAERVHLFLPGRRRSDESFSLTGLITDRYRNVPSAAEVSPYWQIVLEGPETIDLGTPAGHLACPHRFVMPLPRLAAGVYRARAFDLRSDRTVARSNPFEVMPAGDGHPSVYWGEIHGHSRMSDGTGDFAEIFRFAREETVLDFGGAADHACYFTDNQWRRMQDTVNDFNRDGEFVTLIGYEWAGNQGHRNVYTRGDRLELFRGMSVASCELNTVYEHFAGRNDVVAGPHTRHCGDFWKHHAPEVERFFEIYSKWGTFEDTAHEILNGGGIVGFTGGGDCHNARCGWSAESDDPRRPVDGSGLAFDKCGLTAAVMSHLSRTELLAALRDRRTYATTGARILLDFDVSGVTMGGMEEVQGPRAVHVTVHACDDLERIDIVRNGQTVHTERASTLDVSFDWRDDRAPAGRSWYYVKVTQTDGERVWSSPVWVTTRAK